ncbi:MAG: hypothetical protein K6A92_05190 [Lachnospiraceae bacterium]|nr:hypothetical protein [Lachnospiraceae bacterium]
MDREVCSFTREFERNEQKLKIKELNGMDTSAERRVQAELFESVIADLPNMTFSKEGQEAYHREKARAIKLLEELGADDPYNAKGAKALAEFFIKTCKEAEKILRKEGIGEEFHSSLVFPRFVASEYDHRCNGLKISHDYGNIPDIYSELGLDSATIEARTKDCYKMLHVMLLNAKYVRRCAKKNYPEGYVGGMCSILLYLAGATLLMDGKLR